MARILTRATVLLLSDVPDAMVRDMHMLPAHSVEEALQQADTILTAQGIENGTIFVIPDGVSVIVEKR